MNRPEINVTPLIDVLLVLLIIFMVVTPMKPSSFDARVPNEPKNDSREIPDPNTLIVIYSADATLRINNESNVATISDTTGVSARLREIFAAREENGNDARTVFIKAPKSLDYGSVARIIDAIKAAGADPISLQIDDLE